MTCHSGVCYKRIMPKANDTQFQLRMRSVDLARWRKAALKAKAESLAKFIQGAVEDRIAAAR